MMSINRDVIESRIREINDGLQIFGDLASKDFVQLRNLLVRRYWVIDDEKVFIASRAV